jgi:asparagine synthase (glutamine-hydrolysing)
MPGIAGLITKMPRESATAELQRMLQSMNHESFYVQGTYCDEELGVYAGFVDRSDACDTPMPQRNESGNKVLLFSGDEFPEQGTAAALARRGHQLDKGSRAHLVHLAEEDPAFPLNLNGQFQGLLADRAQRSLKLFVDRYGLRRVYYHESPDAFYFAAEAKAILAVRPELRRLDPQGLGDYAVCGCVLEERTLFKGIHTLPQASAWIFRNGRLAERGKYFSADDLEQQEPMEAGEFYRSVREVFERSLPRYFSGEQPIAVSLTGGLDTRMIMAWHKPHPLSLPCYTFGGVLRECRDVKIARRVARATRQPHSVISVGRDFLRNFAHYAERSVYLTDGCASVRSAPDLYVNKMARAIAPVRLTGNYGDQVLRHLVVFRASAPSRTVFSPAALEHTDAAIDAYERLTDIHPLTLATTYQTAYHYFGLLALESTQVNVRTPYLDNELIRLLYRSPKTTLHNNDMRVRLIRDGSPLLRAIRTDLGYAGRGGKIVGKFSQKFHLFTMRLEYACEHGDPRWLTRIDQSLLWRQLERSFVGRHKFTHFCMWYRNELAGYVREMLLDDRTRTRDYLNGANLEKMVNDHLSGAENYTPEISRILTLEHLHRSLIDA